MAVLTVQTIIRAGIALATKVSCSAGGDTFVNDGKTFLIIANSSGGGLNVTVDAVSNCDQGFDHNNEVTVGDGETDLMIGPFPTATFGRNCAVTYTGGVTNLTVKPVSSGA